MIYLYWAMVAVLCGILGRMGGSGNYSRQWRIVGIPAVGLTALGLNLGFTFPYAWLAYFLSFGLMVGALSTYFKKADDDAKWWNWLLVGLANGLALIPIGYVFDHWLGFVARLVFLAVTVTLSCQLIGGAVIEEFVRYFLIGGSLILLTIGG